MAAGNGRATVDRELNAVQTAKYHPSFGLGPSWGGPGGTFGALGPFALGHVDAMRQDEQVALCLEYLLTPLLECGDDIVVEGDSQEEIDFVTDQAETFWAKGVPVTFESHVYGRVGAELVCADEGGYKQFSFLNPIHPRDARPYTKEGKLAFVQVSGSGAGLVAGDQDTLGQGGIRLRAATDRVPAKGTWWTHGATYSRWYGRSIFYPIWWPWRAKVQPDAALDSMLKWLYKWGVTPTVVRSPDEVLEDEETGNTIAGSDYCIQIMTTVKNAGVVWLSSARDEHGNYRYVVENWSEMKGRAQDLVEPIEFLNKMIQRGLRIPDEVLTFSGEGSQARASVSTKAFWISRHKDARQTLEDADRQVFRPLARWNGFQGAYKIRLRKPEEKQQQQAGQGQNWAGDPSQGQQQQGDPLAALLGGGAQMSMVGRCPTAAEIAEAAARADPDPTPAQRESGSYRKGHVTLHGLPITIEVAKGGTRKGVGKDGVPWERRMAAHYGYLKRAVSEADGDHLDVYLGEHPESRTAYVVDQLKVDGAFDEHKILLAFPSLEEARAAYLAHYPPGWRGLGAITAVPVSVLRLWAAHGDTSKPLGDLSNVSLSQWTLAGEGPRGGKVWRNEHGVEFHGPKPPEGRVANTPAERRRQEVTQQVGDAVTGAAITGAKAAGSVVVTLKEAASAVAGRIGQAAWERLPPEAQAKLAKVWSRAKAVEHRVMTGFRVTRELAVEAARERGVRPETAEMVGKVLAGFDLALAWTVNMPVAAAAAAPLGPGAAAVAGKAASWLPVASLAYVAYSTARDFRATLRAARTLIRRKREAGPHAALSMAAGRAGVLGPDEVRTLAGELAGRIERHGDWYVALASAALDETHDAAEAIRLADAAVAEDAHGPDGPPPAALSQAGHSPTEAAFYVALSEEVKALREGLRTDEVRDAVFSRWAGVVRPTFGT